jgi:hypothetical protein
MGDWVPRIRGDRQGDSGTSQGETKGARTQMTPIEKQILNAVNAGGKRCHLKYLPEVLALVAKGKLNLLSSGPDILEISIPKETR